VADGGLRVGIQVAAEAQQVGEGAAFAHHAVLDVGKLAPDHEDDEGEQHGVDIADQLDEDGDAFDLASGDGVEAGGAERGIEAESGGESSDGFPEHGLGGGQ